VLSLLEFFVKIELIVHFSLITVYAISSNFSVSSFFSYRAIHNSGCSKSKFFCTEILKSLHLAIPSTFGLNFLKRLVSYLFPTTAIGTFGQTF
jgi:hypothetical protein